MHNFQAERFYKPHMINGMMASADGPIKTFPLRGVKDSPPYLHDGRLLTLVVTFQMGGAINRVGPTDTAYAERSAPWMSSIDGNWENPADNEANIALGSGKLPADFSLLHWDDLYNLHRPGGRDHRSLGRQCVRRDMARLATIKAKYDPDNFFRLNANIAPASTAASR